MPIVALLTALAAAASLDNLEVGGPWGSPTATDPTALWWNPAGAAGGRGTRILLDGEQVAARVTFDREDPYNGGLDIYTTRGAIPFGGVVTDLGVEVLGLGLGLGVPIARGGAEVDPPGSGAYQMIEGATQQPNLMATAAYQPVPAIGFGVSALYVMAEWSAVTYLQNLSDLDEQIAALGQESGYTDAMIEDPDYGVVVRYDTLKASTLSWAFGLRSQPIPELELGASFALGSYLTHTGEVRLDFGCPPQDDVLGRFGAEAYGICDTTLEGAATVGFAIPPRLRLGAAYTFADRVRAELMGGWTGWSAHTGFALTIDEIAERNDLENPDTAALIEGARTWARDNRDSLWGGLDTKTSLGERWTLGARLLFDRAAVPDATLSPGNYDANTWMATGLVAVKIVDQVELGLRYGRYMAAERTVTDSAYGVSLDDALAPPDAYFYPQMNGSYRSAVSRVGLSLRAQLGG